VTSVTRRTELVKQAGKTRVIAIDGRSGAGKTSLAAALAGALRAPVVTLEDLYGGWDGLERGIDLLVSAVLGPLAAGRAARVPRYDWVRGEWAEPWTLAPPGLLIVEGVGAGARRAARYESALIWLEETTAVRRRRALDRDGGAFTPHWDRWAAQEDALLDRERTQDRAGLVLRDQRDSAAVVAWLSGQMSASGSNPMTERAASVTDPDSDG
jgi:energy-coupling factor transporter ATP-binding protein EcfA2